MTRALTKSEISSLAEEMRRLLSAIESGDLEASVAMRRRIEGALAVLRVVTGDSKRKGLDIANDHMVYKQDRISLLDGPFKPLIRSIVP